MAIQQQQKINDIKENTKNNTKERTEHCLLWFKKHTWQYLGHSQITQIGKFQQQQKMKKTTFTMNNQ